MGLYATVAAHEEELAATILARVDPRHVVALPPDAVAKQYRAFVFVDKALPIAAFNDGVAMLVATLNTTMALNNVRCTGVRCNFVEMSFRPALEVQADAI